MISTVIMCGYWLAGMGFSVLFWWQVSQHLTLPGWQVAVLPAALIGWMTSMRASKWNGAMAVLVVAGAVLSAVIGELAQFNAEFRSQVDRAVAVQRKQSLAAAVGGHIRKLEIRRDREIPPNPVDIDAAKTVKQSGDPPIETGNVQSTGPVHEGDDGLPGAPTLIATPKMSFDVPIRLYFHEFRRSIPALAASMVLSLLAALQAARMALGRAREGNGEQIQPS